MLISEESHLSNISTEKEKQDDGDIRCPNCSWYFSSNTKPYILPCFHNLCDKCINILIQQKNPKCPLCSKIFTHEETNPFQVNFAFLNLVTKILSNKVIFCKKCYKIFYWYEHYTICDQENFIEVDDIFNDIKNYCEKGIEIINIFNNNNNNNENENKELNIFNTSLNKYKNEIMVLLSKLILKIRKKNCNKIKKDVDKIFIIKEKKNIKFEFDYKEIKNKIINFLLICIEHSEYFNRDDIMSVIQPYLYNTENNRESTYFKKGNEIMIKNNIINQTTRCSNSSNSTISKYTKKIFKPENNYSCENTNYLNKLSTNPNQILFIKTPTKKKIFFENQTSKIYKIKEKVLLNENKNQIKIFSPDTFLLKNKKYFNKENKENKQINKKEIESEEEEFIDNFDDDYHEINNINNDMNYKPDKFNKMKLINRNSNLNIKDIFEKSLLQDSKSEKKLIIGLNEVKVISLKKKINKNMKLSLKDINNTKTNLNNSKEKNILNNSKKNNNINIKIFKKKRINSISTLNSIFSTEITKSNNNSNTNILNKNNDNKMNKKINSPTNVLSDKSKNLFNINLYDLKVNKNNSKMIFLNQSNNNIKKTKPVINTNNINNNFFEYNNKKNNYINNLSNTNNNSMNKIFKNFNNIKDIVNNVNEYVKITKYIGDNVDNNLEHNINVLKKNISEDYTLLLDDVVNNFINIQRRFLFSFKNNTKFIILYDTEYNNFIPLDLSDILPNFPNFNSSMQFEFIENNDHYLLFISGGNTGLLKTKENPEHSNDTFIIINIKINIDINNKNKINYKKKYIIEHKDKMPSGKSNHSILYHKNNLYIIGGFDANKNISNECFYFSCKEKKWYELPKLNIQRANGSLCMYNKSLLYVFRGRNNEGELNSIEYLNINNKSDNMWILVNVVDCGYVWNNAYNSCTVVLDENKILIFGGENENKLYKDCFLFDIKSNNVYRGMNLKIPASFCSQGIYNNGKIYGFDFKNKNGDYDHKIHIFDVKNNIWSLINTGNNNTSYNLI